jgi:two-component system response regulator NreC
MDRARLTMNKPGEKGGQIHDPRDGAKPAGDLTAREREVVVLIAEGKRNKEVADALGITVRTAETHRARILRKLKVDSVAGLVRYAVRHGIIEA